MSMFESEVSYDRRREDESRRHQERGRCKVKAFVTELIGDESIPKGDSGTRHQHGRGWLQLAPKR